MSESNCDKTNDLFIPSDYLKTIFLIPIYLRPEKQYYLDNKKENNKAIEKYGKIRCGREVGKAIWPLWICNDIIGFLHIGVDPKGSYRFYLYGIDHDKGYKRIPKHPGGRRSNIMGGIAHEKYGFKVNFINCSDEELVLFLREFQDNLEKRGKYIDLGYWIKIIKCLDVKKLLSET